MKPKSNAYWQKKLTPEQYRILRQGGTEPPFSGSNLASKKPGVYTCGACNQKLFDSKTKYDSGSGWPSFWQALDSNAIKLHDDNTLGMNRVEVTCSNCDSHLGHVFDDLPAGRQAAQSPTGKRYCINSLALNFTTHTP